MRLLLNLIYLTVWLGLAPWLCWQAWVRKKPVRGLIAKWLGRAPTRARSAGEGDTKSAAVGDHSNSSVAWFHGVSVGEVHLLRQVIARFRTRFPSWRCVVSTTTATGHDEARKHFADLDVFFFPFDFTWAVNNALQTIQPTLVVLSEGEMWPNFIRAAKKQGIKIAVINGRMSPRSARRFQMFRWMLAGVFGQIDWIGAQSDEYREHFEMLGAPRVVTTGNIKYDGVSTDRASAKTLALRDLLGISSDALVWVAGSTQEPEEALAIDIYRRAMAAHPDLRLILVPRHPERFDDVARLLERSGLGFVRRSLLTPGVPSPPIPLPEGEGRIVLVDTIGELNAIWGMADVAFVGGSLDGKRGGQNMIEPSAYGAAVLFGPFTWNFKQTVADLLARDAAIEVQNGADLESAVRRLLHDSAERKRLGAAARAFVLSQQGATTRTLDELQTLMNRDQNRNAA